jgi:predicted ATPase
MLTRLKVSGFKNLVDVDVRFGPFTCIAGANGVGKSNLFDAIGFLSALAEMPLMEAAKSIRGGRTADVANLFHRAGERHDETISFMAEMIIPKSGADDLGQPAEATITFLRYSLELSLRESEGSTAGGLEIRKMSWNTSISRTPVSICCSQPRRNGGSRH